MARTQNTPTDAAEQTSAPSRVKSCQCNLGFQGDGKGSSLTAANSHPFPCDATTTRSFRQGHDARMVARLATEVAAGLTTREIATEVVRAAGGSKLLEGKMLRSATLRTEAAAKKAGRAAAKQASAQAQPEATEAEATEADTAPATVTAASSNGHRPATRADLDGLLDDIANETGEATPSVSAGDVVDVTHGQRKFHAVATELGSGDLRLVHDVKGGKSCLHQLNGAFIATVGKIEA
jgi:hypothetical protein